MAKIIKSILLNWQTTAAGLGMVLTALFALWSTFADGDPNTNPDWNVIFAEVMEGLALIFGGFGLVASRVAWKSSQDSGIRR